MDYILFHDRDWSWLKFPGIPPQESRDKIKAEFGARWGRKKVAWYIERIVTTSEIETVLGTPLGVVLGRAPTMTWDYCLSLIGLGQETEQQSVFGESVPVVKASSGSKKIAAKFRAMAERLDAQIAHKSRPMTQNPTRKRMGEYEGRLHDAENLRWLQKALYKLAELHESGKIPTCLADLKIKADIEKLVYTRYQDHEFGNKDPEAIALQEMIAGNPLEQEERRRARELVEAENKAILSIGQIPGFFPTPRPVAERLIRLANIEPGMSVLEPSAGSGAIADVIRELHPEAELHCIEYNYSLQKLLLLKNHRLTHTEIGGDFLCYPVAKSDLDNGIDRIVMNPPFENGQDMAHVRHAYDCLKAGGRLVSVMSESTFFRMGKSTQEFREWLDEVGGQDEDLEVGAFAPHTDVKTRIVVIDK